MDWKNKEKYVTIQAVRRAISKYTSELRGEKERMKGTKAPKDQEIVESVTPSVSMDLQDDSEEEAT